MDPALWELIEEGNGDDEIAAIIRLGQPGTPPDGVRLVAQFADIATCRLKRVAIPAVREEEEVVSFKAPRLLAPEEEVELDDYEDFESSRSFVDERRPPNLTATGRGVVIGVVDWGCDFVHPDFRNADGSTRLLALWDQRPSSTTEPSNRYGYGRIHTREAINRALEADDPYVALDYHPADSDTGRGAHGTHVLGIACGNGRAGGPPGVAPAADIVFVHSSTWGPEGLAKLGDSVTLLEAVDFILQTAGNRPCVINLSMGRHGEQHDGSTLVEQGLDAALRVAPGRAIVQSTGNYFDRRIHSSGQMRPTEEKTLVWEIHTGDVTANEMEIWYSGLDCLDVEIRSPGDELLTQVTLGKQAALTIEGRLIGKIYHRRSEPNNLCNHIEIFLYSDAPQGGWKVTLTGKDVVDGRFHAWIERDAVCPNCQSRFRKEDAVALSTTGTICNGFRTIAVGAYNPHSTRRELAPFSSSGPTRDGRQKPDLIAPGVLILAARSAPKEPHGDTPLLTRMSGTSMASPYVAGTVALMFEAAQRPLRIEETHNLLLASTRKASAPIESIHRVGSGYCDMEHAVRAAGRVGGIGPQVKRENVEGELTMNPVYEDTATTDPREHISEADNSGEHLTPLALFDEEQYESGEAGFEEDYEFSGQESLEQEDFFDGLHTIEFFEEEVRQEEDYSYVDSSVPAESDELESCGEGCACHDCHAEFADAADESLWVEQDLIANESFEPALGEFSSHDVIDSRIDVSAQFALLRMQREGGAAAVDAAQMLEAIKITNQLAGIFGDDLRAAADLARRLNTQRWLLVPNGEDAALVLDPAAPTVAPPTIIFRGGEGRPPRDGVRSIPQRLDPALRKAWATFQLLRAGRLVQCNLLIPGGPPSFGASVESQALLGAAISNLVPSILCTNPQHVPPIEGPATVSIALSEPVSQRESLDMFGEASHIDLILPVGQVVVATATGSPLPVGTPAYTWANTDPSVARVVDPANNRQTHPNNVTITGLRPGTATITVTYRHQSGATATADISLTVVKVEMIELQNPPGRPDAIPGINDLERPILLRGVANRTAKVKFEPTSFWAGKTAQWTFTSIGRVRGRLIAGHNTNLEQERGFNFTPSNQRSVINANGTAAVRVNMPPVAFNKCKLEIASVDSPTVKTAINLEVPGIVVIDPGHGGNANLSGSSSNNATSVSGVLEKIMTLDIGIRVRDALNALRTSNTRNLRVFMTRDTDVNVAGAARANVARDNGADVLLSIHFNADSNANTRGIETFVRALSNNNVNRDEDLGLARRIQNAVVGVIGSRDRGVKDDTATNPGSLAVLSDISLGNTAALHPIRSCLVELEFITNPTVDQLFNTGANINNFRQQVANAIRDAIVEDLLNQP